MYNTNNYLHITIARHLKPYIRRDYDCTPLKLQLLREIVSHHRRGEAEGERQTAPSSPIDYCYVTARHIPAMNQMARHFFWPGIDCEFCCLGWVGLYISWFSHLSTSTHTHTRLLCVHSVRGAAVPRPHLCCALSSPGGWFWYPGA